MPTTVVSYRSTDAGAPVLTGAAGEYVALLKACLVDGYGARAAAGWTRPYSGTNKAAFRMGGGNQFYVRVADSIDVASYQVARARGYETMSDVDTGTGPYPTDAQVGVDGQGSRYNYGGVPRPWKVFADDRTAYVFTDPLGTTTYYAAAHGDFYSYLAADAYRCMCIAGDTGGYTDQLESLVTTDLSLSLAGHYVARDTAGTAGALLVGKHGDAAKGSGTVLKGALSYPNLADLSLHLAPVYLHEIATPLIRGKMRGFWHWLHGSSGVGDVDTFTGLAGTDFAGRTFEIVMLGASGAVFCIETSSTWDTSA